jgi:capsular polysaccharide biosynthesis protein
LVEAFPEFNQLPILVPAEMKKFVREVLELTVDPARLRPVQAGEILCDDIVLVSPPGEQACAPFSLDWVRRALAAYRAPKTTGLKLFLSRRGNLRGRRHLVNVDEVWEVLQRRGFVEFNPEEHHVKDQVRVFSEAEFIVGVTGSSFVNLIFAEPGTKVIEIAATRDAPIPTWQYIGRYVGMKMGVLYGDKTYPPAHQPYFVSDQDFHVDPDLLCRALDRAEAW